jgi:hypothetical protein
MKWSGSRLGELAAGGPVLGASAQLKVKFS